MTPKLSVVIPHWPVDEEVNAALARCVASLPPDSEKIVVVNDGTGFGRNVNTGLRLASAEYVAVVNNDVYVAAGDVYELCIPGAVASPLVIGDVPAVAPPLEPGGFHGCFWVAPREVLDRVGLLDDRFEGAFWEDDDLLLRLRGAGIPTRQVASVRVKHRGGLTMLKVPERAEEWYRANERRFEEKWGFLPPPLITFRRARGSETWHFCNNCAEWPSEDYEERDSTPPSGECAECRSKWDSGACEYTGGYA